MGKETYLLFTIQGYDQLTSEGVMKNMVTIMLVDETPDKAMERAKKLIEKPLYRIESVGEYFRKDK